MTSRHHFAALLTAAILAAAPVTSAMADDPPPAPREEALSKAVGPTARLLQLMDKDQNGKVSKQEFLAFMEAEFDRLDRDKSGELDLQELDRLMKRGKHPGGSGGR